MAYSDKLVIAVSSLLTQQPFFASLLYDLCDLKEDPEFPFKGGTDGKTIWINPIEFAKLHPAQGVFLLCHEIMHIVWQHMSRMKIYQDLGTVQGRPYDHTTANMAADAIINQMLIDAKVGKFIPEGVIHDHISGEMGFEEAYKIIYEEQKKNRGNGRSSGQGSGQGFDQHIPTSGGKTPAAAEVARAVKSATSAAKAVGKMPGGAIGKLAGEIDKPKIPWHERMRDRLTQIVSGRDAYSWARPSRRKLALTGQGWPGSVGLCIGTVVVAIDTSGSVGAPELLSFRSENCSILSDLRPDMLYALWCDTKIQRVDEFTTVDDFLGVVAEKGVPGRGGTSFIPPFEWVEENGIRPDVLIYFTDGEGSPPSTKPDYPVIWVTTHREIPGWENIKLEVE